MSDREQLQKAIETIRDYCSSHICEECLFSENMGEMCGLQIEMPHNWYDVEVYDDD